MRSSCSRPASTALARDDAGDDQRHGGVFGGGERGQQIELLKDEADVLPAEACLLAVGHLRQVAAHDEALAVGEGEDAGDDRQQRRLAAAAGADQHGHLAGVNVEIGAAERVRLRCDLG